MTPAHERLEACEIHVGEPGNRLIEDLDLVALEGTAQFRFAIPARMLGFTRM